MPDATARELKILVAKDESSIRRQVARRSNALPGLLKKLFNEYYFDVLNNPVSELILLEKPDFLSILDDTTSYSYLR